MRRFSVGGGAIDRDFYAVTSGLIHNRVVVGNSGSEFRLGLVQLPGAQLHIGAGEAHGRGCKKKCERHCTRLCFHNCLHCEQIVWLLYAANHSAVRRIVQGTLPGTGDER